MSDIYVLDVRIDDVARKDVPVFFSQYLRSKDFHHVATVNPEFLILANKLPKFKKVLNTSALNICDGVGISIVSRLLYNKKISRIAGVEIADILCESCEKENKSIYLIGGFGVVEGVANRLNKKFPNLKISGYEDGDPKIISEQLKKSAPDAILVAFGAPNQEIWLKKAATEIPSLSIGIGIGGTFDFWVGKAIRAPKIVQKIGLEWLWRLMLEPRKRGARIFKSVFVFLYLVLKASLKRKEVV